MLLNQASVSTATTIQAQETPTRMLLVTKLAPVKALIRWTCGKEAGGIFLEPAAL